MFRHQAGRSARKKARELRIKHTRTASKWGGWTAVAGSTAGALTLKDLVATAVVGGVAGLGTTAWHLRKPSGAARWIQGAKAEERTEDLLRPLVKRYGWWVAHDLKVPRSNSNLDHVAAPPSGRFLTYLDTKAWHMKSGNGAPAKIKWDGSRLMYGRFNVADKMETVKWQARRLSEETGLACVPVIVVDGAQLTSGGHNVNLLRIGEFYLVSSEHLFEALINIDGGAPSDWSNLNRVRSSVESKFLPAA